MVVAVGGLSGDGLPFPVTDVPAAATTPDAVIRFLVGSLAASGRVPPDRVAEIADAVIRRERLGSTGIGRGLAIPHASTPVVTAEVIVAGRLAARVAWDAVDSQPIRLVCLSLTPVGGSGAHVRHLERVVAFLRGEGGSA